MLGSLILPSPAGEGLGVRASIKLKRALRRIVELKSEQRLSSSNTPYRIQQIKLDALVGWVERSETQHGFSLRMINAE
jgi:hypothetical protein